MSKGVPHPLFYQTKTHFLGLTY
ncbi:hypothetical protein LINPERHAP1_LOCUS37415 [Linum perenne]